MKRAGFASGAGYRDVSSRNRDTNGQRKRKLVMEGRDVVIRRSRSQTRSGCSGWRLRCPFQRDAGGRVRLGYNGKRLQHVMQKPGNVGWLVAW